MSPTRPAMERKGHSEAPSQSAGPSGGDAGGPSERGGGNPDASFWLLELERRSVSSSRTKSPRRRSATRRTQPGSVARVLSSPTKKIIVVALTLREPTRCRRRGAAIALATIFATQDVAISAEHMLECGAPAGVGGRWQGHSVPANLAIRAGTRTGTFEGVVHACRVGRDLVRTGGHRVVSLLPGGSFLAASEIACASHAKSERIQRFSAGIVHQSRHAVSDAPVTVASAQHHLLTELPTRLGRDRISVERRRIVVHRRRRLIERTRRLLIRVRRCIRLRRQDFERSRTVHATADEHHRGPRHPTYAHHGDTLAGPTPSAHCSVALAPVTATHS
jgi:hypothetical protein